MFTLNVKSVGLVLASLILSGCSQDIQFASSLMTNKKACIEDCTTSRIMNESFTIPDGSGKADVLFVLDSTPPMQSTLSDMHNRMGDLLSQWQIDWQVGFTNASLNPADNFTAGELTQISPNNSGDSNFTTMTADTGSYWELFTANMNFQYTLPGMGNYCGKPPYCSRGPVEPLRGIKTLIENRSRAANAKFFREGAVFVPVIISSSDENAGSGTTSVNDVVDAYEQHLGSKMAGMHAISIIVKPNDAACLAKYTSFMTGTVLGGYSTYGHRLNQLAQETGGKTISLCEQDLGKALKDLSGVLGPSVGKVTLAQTPVEGSVKVVSVPAFDIGFTVSGKEVKFDRPVPAKSVISVSYLVK